MRNLLTRLLVVALLLVACSGAVWGDGLKVTITKKGGGTEIKTGQASLAMAFKWLALKEVEGIEVSAGTFTEADWEWLMTKRQELSGLKKFEVTNDIRSVADIPNSSYHDPYFGAALEELRVAKLNEVGRGAFARCSNLRSVSLPSTTKIGEDAFHSCGKLAIISIPRAANISKSAFDYCSGLKTLKLGATPPSNVGKEHFTDCPLARELELIKSDGTPLTGSALDNAKSRYKSVNDGDTGDNLWYGWAFEEFPASNLSGTIDGVAFTKAASLEAAMQGKVLKNVKKLTITGGTFQVSDWAFLQEQGKDKLQIEQFTIENSVAEVVNMPDLSGKGPYLPSAQSVRIERVQKVGMCAFAGCTSLTSVSLPVATNIGGSAFSRCENLTSVSLPSATEIGSYGFHKCAKLQLVSLPNATNIGYRAFLECVKLKTLQLGATPPSKVEAYAFTGCPFARELELIKSDGTPLTGSALDNAKSRYKSVNDGDTGDNFWYGWALEKIPSSNLSGTMDGVAFTNAASLEAAMQGKVLKNVKKLTITGGTFQILDWSFLLEQGQHGLAIEKFTIASSVDRVADIPDLPRYSPPYLPSAQIVRIEKVQKVGAKAFEGCTSLTSVSLPAATNIDYSAFEGCTSLTSVSLPSATEIGSYGFYKCAKLQLVSLPSATNIKYLAFGQCVKLKTLKLGPTPPTSEGDDVFDNCPAERTLIITDAMGVPLVGTALATAADNYDGNVGDPNDGKWWGWTIETNPPITLSVIVEPADAGTAKITRKDGGAVVNEGETLTKDEVLIVKGEPDGTYEVKKITATGASNTSGNEWKVTAESGAQVVFTVEFEKLATLGATIKTPAGTGEVTITRKDGGAVVSQGDVLKEGAVLVVAGKPVDGYRVKAITAAGAKKIGEGNEWKVTAKTGEVIFTVEFEKVATLGATVITPAGSGTVSITRKASGNMVNKGDALTKDEVLIVKGEPDGTHKVKKITAAGATNTSGNEWEVTATSGEVTFTVEFEKAQGENNNSDPTPVESVLLAQVQLSPNPTDGQVTIDAGTTIARCEVYSGTGALLQTIEAPESVFPIDLTASPSGVYLVRLVDMQGGCKTLRVVKQ